MQAHEAKALIGLLGTYWPSQKLPESSVIAWIHQLQPYPYDDTKRAIDLLVANNRYMPSIAEIIKTIRADWARRTEPMLPEPGAMTMEEFVEANPEWKERVEAFPSKATPRREERVSDLPVDRYQKLQAEAAELDRPQSAFRRKKSECTDHRFLMHDRCYYCGAPA